MKHFIFDLDGTLWDSSEAISEAWNSVLIKHNYDPVIDVNFISSIMGKSNFEIIEILNVNYKIDIPSILDLFQEAELEYVLKGTTRLYDNVIDVLKELSKDNMLYIVSNCQNGYIEAFLKKYNLEKIFKDYICTDVIYENKTQSLRALLDRNNILEFYYIGDTKGDQNATNNNNGTFIYASYGFGKCEEKNVINQFSDLLHLI